jgi:MYXO-CTERM domain-containing protein
VAYWSTIRLADVDGDGRADLCARGPEGFACHLSTGGGFGEAVVGPGWADDVGWSDHDNYSTIRMADLDGDGALDVCARATAGIRCALWRDGGFSAEHIAGPDMSDDHGWSAIRFFSTLRLADVNADGRADLCGRASAGVRCWLFDGAAFAATPIEGPGWSDDSGWGGVPYYESIRVVSPVGRCAPQESCNGVDDDCDGEVDEGCVLPEAPDPEAAAEADAGADAGWPGYGGTEAGCSCRAAGRTDSPAWLWPAIVLALFSRRSRRGRDLPS